MENRFWEFEARFFAVEFDITLQFFLIIHDRVHVP